MNALLALVLTCAPDAGHWYDHCRLVADNYLLDAGVVDAGPVIECDFPVYAHRFGATKDTHHDVFTYDNGHPVPQFLSLRSENGTPHSGTMPGQVLELHGYESDENPGSPLRSGVEIYCLGRNYSSAGHNSNSCVGIGSEPSSNKVGYFTPNGDFYGRDLLLTTDNNELHVQARSAYGAGGTARLQLKGQTPAGSSGPDVYVTPTSQRTAGEILSVLNWGSSGFHVSYQGGAQVGLVPTNQLPSCASNVGRILYDTTKNCLVACNGTSWACLQRTGEGWWYSLGVLSALGATAGAFVFVRRKEGS